MAFYLTKKLIGAAVTLFLLATLTFFALRLAPGGPFDGERVFPEEIQKHILAKYELDRPLIVQFGNWIEGVLQGDLRESFQYLGQPVTNIIGAAIPYSIELGILALVFAIVFGIPLGAVAAWKQNSLFDGVAMFLATSGVSLPGYLVASLLILVFSLQLNWFPPALWEGPSSMVLPMITLGLRPMAMIARLTRASMLEALQSDYIRTAYGKGLGAVSIIFKHALRNSVIPVITLLGPISAHLITGSFLVEMVFQIPGIGKYFVSAVINRDYPLVMGMTLTYGCILILSNLGVDLAYGWVDPRIRIQKS